MDEQNFLREKTTALYERENTVTDVTTGELISRETETKRKISQEPDYIKVYYKVMLAAEDIKDIPLDFILALAAQISFINDNSPVYFYNNKTTRRAIGEQMHIADNMVSKYLKRATGTVLFRTTDRGTYEVNPWMIAKGKWEHIRKLQMAFEFEEGSGKWRRVITSSIPEEDLKEAI